MNNNILWGKEVYPYIISVLDSMNISRDYAPYVFAMAANESGWGLNPSGKYNYFGMKATKNLKGTVRTTHEGFGSNRVKINDKFLDFESLQDGIKRGIERLNNRFGAFSVPVKLFTWNLHLNGYYTDTPAHYEDTINGIINGRSFRNVLNGLSIPERLNINQTNWNSVPRWQPPVQFKKGGNLISKFQQGGAPRHYYTTDSNILPELIVSPLGNSYVVDEFGNPARTVDTLKEAQKYGGYVGVIRDAMSDRELKNNLKHQGHDEYLAQQKQADQQVYQIIPSIGLMFDIATVGGLNNLSPTQWMRRVYDTRKLIQGKMSGNDYINHWFFGNNGIASDEYARKHPYRAMAANLIGDIATFGTASALRKMPSWYRAMLAENQMAQDIVADNWRNIGRGSVGYDVRTGLVAEEIPAEYMPKQIVFIHPAEAVNPAMRGTRLYVRPVTNVNKYEFNIMSDGKSKPITVSGEAEDPIIYKTTRSGLPYVKSDLEALRTLLPTEHNYKGQTVRVYKLDGKLAMTELEYNALMDKFRPILTEEEFNNPILSEEAKTELKKALKLHKKIIDTYSEGIEDIKALTKQDYGSAINWDWYNGGILAQSNIPAKVATSPVFDLHHGKVIDSRPIMLRFYENVLNKNGIIQKTLKELIDKGILIPNEGRWFYQPPGESYKELVDPTRFILNYILEKELGSVNRIPYIRRIDQLSNTFIPYHSTPIGDASITLRFANPTKTRPLFTSIDNGKPGFAPLRMAYKRTKFGTSIPVMTRDLPRTEEYYLISNNGLHGSNNFGEVGELMSHFQSNGGKPQKVLDVSDARNIKGNTGQRQDELNFGTGTPDVGFILNTFDFKNPVSVVGPFQGYKKGGRLTINNTKMNNKSRITIVK